MVAGNSCTYEICPFVSSSRSIQLPGFPFPQLVLRKSCAEVSFNTDLEGALFSDDEDEDCRDRIKPLSLEGGNLGPHNKVLYIKGAPK